MVLKEPVSLQDTLDKLIIASSEEWLSSLKTEVKNKMSHCYIWHNMYRNLYDITRDMNDTGVVVTGIVVGRL